MSRRNTSTLTEGSYKVFIKPDPAKKTLLSHAIANAWRKRELSLISRTTLPKRHAHPKTTPTAVSLPHRKPNSSKGLLALMHPIAHIELIAIDLARDLIAQFTLEDLPQTFYDDWVNVAAGERRHFSMLTK